MAGDWIKIEHVTPDKPEVFRMADELNIDPDSIVGKLCRIWIWADQQTTDGNAPSVTKSLVDRFANVTGFADAMIHVGWLDKTDDGLRFINFEAHNGQTAKARALTARRVAKHKTKGNAKGNAVSVSDALPREEKRREELNTEETSPNGDVCTESGETPDPSTPNEPTEFIFECSGKGAKTWTLPKSKLNEYLESYPDLDVRAEIRKARQWIRDNPKKRKTAGRGVLSFLTAWLNRSQNSGGRNYGNQRTRGPIIGPGQSYDPNHRGSGEF